LGSNAQHFAITFGTIFFVSVNFPDFCGVIDLLGIAAQPTHLIKVEVSMSDITKKYTNGEVTIKDSQGNFTHKNNTAALCRCGRPANKPYCDGNHKEMVF